MRTQEVKGTTVTKDLTVTKGTTVTKDLTVTKGLTKEDLLPSAPFARRTEDPNPNTIRILFAKLRTKTVRLPAPSFSVWNAIIVAKKDTLLQSALTRSVSIAMKPDIPFPGVQRHPKKSLTNSWTKDTKTM